MVFMYKAYGRKWALRDGRWYEIVDGERRLSELGSKRDVAMVAEIERLQVYERAYYRTAGKSRDVMDDCIRLVRAEKIKKREEDEMD